MFKPGASLLTAAVLGGLLLACSPAAAPSPATAQAAPTVPPPAVTLLAQPTSLSPAPTATRTAPPPVVPTVTLPDPDRRVWPGPISQFEMAAEFPEAQLKGSVLGFHLNREEVTFRVHYTPGEPHYLAEWAFRLSRDGPAPLLIVPGGFFTEDYLAQGLLVSDGVEYNPAHSIGGVFGVQGGQASIRWLEVQPIRPGEEFEQAVQSFPVYVSRGAIPPLNEHDNRAPRTVIAETREGDFIVLLSLTSLFRTIDLPAWLLNAELDIHNALNLDGGRSAGYWAGADNYRDSFVPLPVVIAVYAK